MELRHLRYFIAVAEELNFSRAAERLHVSQPPLSRQIRSLEAELKVKLLDRNTQAVLLTRVGHAVLARSRKLVRDAESLLAEAQMIEKESQEELRIGYAPSPTAVILSSVLCRYHELSPGAGLTLHDLTHTEMLSGLKAGELHAALTIRPAVGEMRGLKFETIRRHRVGIICSNSNPLAQQPNVRPSVVAMSELVVYRAREFPEYHQWVSKILRVSKGRLIVVQECADALSVVATVESGRGVAVVGEFITAVAGDRVRFVPFVSGAHFQEVGLLYRQSRLGENIRKLVAASLASKATHVGSWALSCESGLTKIW
jgi:LysR family transcriptional regulator, benzoate and cis,cis-muconate-responsive activator of ben and cat genes